MLVSVSVDVHSTVQLIIIKILRFIQRIEKPNDNHNITCFNSTNKCSVSREFSVAKSRFAFCSFFEHSVEFFVWWFSLVFFSLSLPSLLIHNWHRYETDLLFSKAHKQCILFAMTFPYVLFKLFHTNWQQEVFFTRVVIKIIFFFISFFCVHNFFKKKLKCWFIFTTAMKCNGY